MAGTPSLANTRANDGVAPIPAIRGTAIGPLESTHFGSSPDMGLSGAHHLKRTFTGLGAFEGSAVVYAAKGNRSVTRRPPSDDTLRLSSPP